MASWGPFGLQPRVVAGLLAFSMDSALNLAVPSLHELQDPTDNGFWNPPPLGPQNHHAYVLHMQLRKSDADLHSGGVVKKELKRVFFPVVLCTSCAAAMDKNS